MQLTTEKAPFDARVRSREAIGHRPVDLAHLARYTLGNRSLEHEVLGLFLTQSRLYLRRLGEAATDKAWRDAAHTIKGSARGIGAWQVAASAEQAERLAGAALRSGRQQALDALQASVEDVNGYIQSLLVEA